jgi:hypothetical protein
MKVRSALRVAQAFRVAQPGQMNAATMIAVLPLTEEFEELGIPSAGGRQRRAETKRLVDTLAGQGVAPAVLGAIRLPTDDRAVAMRAKTAVALLLWINGTPTSDLESVLTQGMDDQHAIGSVRRVAARAHDLIETVVGIAAELHPAADLASVSRDMPAQLELGIAETFAPLAVSGAGLEREHYLALRAAGLGTPELVGRASDDELLKHLGSAHRLGTLRAAIDALAVAAAIPSLDDLLSPKG